MDAALFVEGTDGLCPDDFAPGGLHLLEADAQLGIGGGRLHDSLDHGAAEVRLGDYAVGGMPFYAIHHDAPQTDGGALQLASSSTYASPWRPKNVRVRACAFLLFLNYRLCL
jgi:hypothetical protein